MVVGRIFSRRAQWIFPWVVKRIFPGGQQWWNIILPTWNLDKNIFYTKTLIEKYPISKSRGQPSCPLSDTDAWAEGHPEVRKHNPFLFYLQATNYNENRLVESQVSFIFGTIAWESLQHNNYVGPLDCWCWEVNCNAKYRLIQNACKIICWNNNRRKAVDEKPAVTLFLGIDSSFKR